MAGLSSMNSYRCLDPRALLAAERAGRRCLRDYPYLSLRYGERGRRFTDSDGGWLAAALPEDGVQPPATPRRLALPWDRAVAALLLNCAYLVLANH